MNYYIRREELIILTCKVGETIINCFDGKYDKYILKKWDSEKRLVCPDCGKLYEYCHGEVVSPYFRHKEKSKECEEIFSEPETEEHIKGKTLLYKWLLELQNNNIVQNVKLEAYIAETRQRPDLYFEQDNKRFVIEYQCSPISSEYLERHRLYELAGIKDIWILATNKYIDKSESEYENPFRKKEIEKHTNFYFDSEYKIFMFNNIDNLKIENTYEIKSTYNCWRNSNYQSKIEYFSKEYRHKFYNNLLCLDDLSKKYMICIEGIEIKNGNILLTPESINNIKEYSNKLKEEELRIQKINEKCESFLNKIFLEFHEKYDTKFSNMSFKYGFKCSKHYYKLDGIKNYPIIDFCKIKYVSNTPIDKFIFCVNIEEEDDINMVIEYLAEDLKEVIEVNLKFKNMVTEYEQRKKDEFSKLKEELQTFNNKPIYLIFMEDNKNIDKNIRFKVVHNYPNDINEIGKVILDNLKFIKSKGVKEYYLMIPRKRIKESTSFLYPTYKVRNYKSDVRDDFNKLGINFLNM